MTLSASAAPGRLSGGYHLAGERRGAVCANRRSRCHRLHHRQSALWAVKHHDRQPVQPRSAGQLLGQIRLALVGQHFLGDGGSITLVSGIVAQEPIAQGVNATTVNAGLEGFVRAAACELPRGIRINLISPTVLSESLAAYGDFFPGFASVPAAAVAQAYRRSIEGVQTGRIYPVGY
jgi:NAD(P)-dependent dehydrogenase (short-subunit alcohol dehydrogenase family)